MIWILIVWIFVLGPIPLAVILWLIERRRRRKKALKVLGYAYYQSAYGDPFPRGGADP